jgi:hypothetical protein
VSSIAQSVPGIFIVSIEIDETNFFWLEDLRRQHFPRERNLLSAHLTMFHRLSLEQILRLQNASLPAHPLPVRFTNVRFLGRGVAIEVASPALVELRETLKQRTGGVLTPQDSQTWRPHITIQNKVAPAMARELFDSLSPAFVPREGYAMALRFWRYLNGPWSRAARRSFGPEAC